MLEWLRKQFASKQEQPAQLATATQTAQTPPPPPPVITDVGNLYSLEERSIYGYFRGERDKNDQPVIVWADPLALWKKLMEHGPELSVRMKVAFSPSKGNVQAHTELVQQVRDAFEVKPFEQGGLTEAECVYLLDHFLTYIGTIKKNSSESTTEPTTETSPPSAPPSADSPPTRSGSDLNSTISVENSGSPPPSHSGPELQSAQ